MEETWDISLRDLTRFWVQFVLVPVVVIVGIFGNVLTIFILTKNKIRLPSNVYLLALAVSDLLFLLGSLFMSWKHYRGMQSLELYWRYIPTGLWITDATSSASIWLTVCFTVERYLAICHPTSTKSTATVKRAATLAGLVYTICFLLTSTTSLEWKASPVISTRDNDTNETTFILENTELGSNPVYRLVYHWFSTVVFVLIPVVLLGIGNLFLIHAVRASQKVRRQLTSCYVHRRQGQLMHQEDRITITLIVIIILFFICQLPTATVLMYTSVHTPERNSVEENVLYALGNVFNLLVAINASCNFVLYTAISDKYREAFLRVLCLARCCKKRRRRNTVYILPEVFSQEEKFRYLQDDLEMDPSSLVCKASDAGALRNVSVKNIVVLRRCATCKVSDKRFCSLEKNCTMDPKSV